MTNVPDDPEPIIYVPSWPDRTPKADKFWTLFDREQNATTQAAHDAWQERQDNPPPDPVLEPTEPADPVAESANAMPLAEITAPQGAAPEPAAPEPAA